MRVLELLEPAVIAAEASRRTERQPSTATAGKVLFISHTGQWGGGAEVMLGQMMEAAKREGLDVELASPPGPLVPRLRPLCTRFYPIEISLPKRTKSAGAMISMAFGWLTGSFRLLTVLRRSQPSVIHANSGVAALQICFAAMMARKPLIWHQYDIVPARRINRLVIGLCGRLCSSVIACSSAVRASLSAVSVPRTRIRVLHNRVRSEFFESLPDRDLARRALGIPQGRIVVLNIGRLVPYKQHLVLLDAIAFLLSDGIDLELLILGEKPSMASSEEDPFPDYEPQLRSRAEQPDLRAMSDSWATTAGVRGVLAAASMLVHPAVDESFPIVVLEAQASGVPVVASDSGGHMEAIKDGETGYLFPVGNPAGLAAAIRRLLSDPARAERVAKLGREWARENYQESDLGPALRGIYASV